MVAFYSLFGVSAAAHAAPPTVVGNAPDLQTELSSPTGDVELSASISAPATSFTVNGTHTLDLAGFSLTTENISLNAGAHLTIKDSGSGGEIIADASGASLAGITTTDATLTIEGGTVKATGGIATGGSAGAGIGGDGRSGSGTVYYDGGTTIINGGTVTATGGQNAAGIGGGYKGDGGTVTINGGDVTATGGGVASAGIGGGNGGDGGTVTINGGDVTATGSSAGAGIGGAGGGTVTINGGTVTATGSGIASSGSAAIGGSSSGGGGTVTIGAGATVTAVADHPSNENGVIGAGNGGSDFGSLTVDGILVVPSGSDLIIPAGVTVQGDGFANGSGSIVNNGIITTTADPVNSAWTVTEHNFAVTLDSGYSGGSDSTTHVYATTMADGVRALPAAPTRTGFDFTEWNTASDGSGNTFSTDTDLTADTTVYAQWTKIPETTDPGDDSGDGSGDTTGDETGDTPADETSDTPADETADEGPVLAATGTDLASGGFVGVLTLLVGMGLLLMHRRHSTQR